VLSAIGKGGGNLLTALPLVVLLPFGALLVSGCSANEAVEGTLGEATTLTDAPVVWNYVALGDSLAVGTGASHEGYVDRYAGYLEADTGAQVSVTNLGQNGLTSPELLFTLRSDSSWRQAIEAAEIITVNIGINDLGHAAQAYDNGACGGTDNQDCLRAATQTVKGNWNAITAELLSLRSTSDTIIRAAGLGYTPPLDTEEVFGPYLDEVNRHIATTASDNDIPLAEVRLDKEHISQDGVHPNDEGYEVIAGQLRELGYSPLK
jgi:lysophospholipase L1-like esterase